MILEDKNEARIEGRNAVLEALSASMPLNKIYIKKGERHGVMQKIRELARSSGIPVVELDPKSFEHMARTRNPQGVIALSSPKEYVSVDDILETAERRREAPFVFVLNEITDPQNLGSILRTADCLGVHGVIIPKRRACGVTPAVVKVSEGAAGYVNVARVTNIASTLECLKEKGLWVVGADMDGEPYHRVDLTGPVALVIGGEDKGLGRLVREKCDLLVKLPMRGHVPSLNAAVAAAVLGYEILRQREGRHD
ncbi:23S rRNA (guanosine(2251)-2'-O)-methyltransferase RlmB [Thermosediminibacter oceani]|uniref:RNA methyltransferase, TrmH family, group 3 n=1 Tax=Thermosediminibacter oceani (strain ATCC BAA-1034 / DSM 16646 / JW/IW-1228P) TaxID=555079 RepID=D9S0G7_THEOJ|nr:23S rRNA (guanosine(2251)-2'-O)-methyltransferase RlmB [Thermosediminibacter oceani]ADL08825.1 RNA methyltransferase, TrmH family, group 3 [Thermosediminibacter oceani DSM 16646]